MSETSHLWDVIQSVLDASPFGATQAQLARAVGVTRQTVGGWKSGASTPTPEHLRALANALTLAGGGRDVYDRLLRAVLLDQGYDVEGHLRSS